MSLHHTAQSIEEGPSSTFKIDDSQFHSVVPSTSDVIHVHNFVNEGGQISAALTK